MRSLILWSFFFVLGAGLLGCESPGPSPFPSPSPSPSPGPGSSQTGWLVAAYKIGSLPTKWGTAPQPRYLSTSPFNYGDGANIEIWGYDSYHSGGTTHKSWYFEPTGTLDHYYLKNVMTGKCLTAEGASVGASISQRRCEAGATKQIWKQELMGSWGIRLRSTLSDKCIESTGFNNGDKVQIAACLPPFPNKFNQLWFTEAQPDAPSPPHDSGKGALCDFCDPSNPVCAESGGKCVITNLGQSICGRQCSQVSPCPQGYNCTNIKLKSGYTSQCIPNNYQCSYEFIAK